MSSVSSPVTLNASSDIRRWSDSVSLTGYKANGSIGTVRYDERGISVVGGRYDDQIDFNPITGKSEVLDIDFKGKVRDVKIVLSRMEQDEWRGLSETGLWKAYNSSGELVGRGKLDASTGNWQSPSTYRFKVASGSNISRLSISATAYGNGVGQRQSNNSDFRLQSLTFSRLDAPTMPPAEKPSVSKPPNRFPTTVDDSATTQRNKEISIDVLGNDSFGGNGPGELTVRSASNGTVSVRRRGTPDNPLDDLIRYIPNNGFVGQDSFEYTIKDADGDTSTSSVQVIVTKPEPVFTPPAVVQRRALSAAAKFITPGEAYHQWGPDVQLSAIGLDGSKANVVFDTQYADHGFGVASGNDRWNQIDFYAKAGEKRNVSEKLKLKFDTLVQNVKLKVGMMGLNEGTNGYDETGRWTAYNARGEKVADGLLSPDRSTLGKDVKVQGSYGSYPIEIDTSRPFAELVVQATGFGHGQGSPIARSYGENNSDFNVMGISFDPIAGTQGGF